MITSFDARIPLRMQDFCSTAAIELAGPPMGSAFKVGLGRRDPIWQLAETAMRRALDAIRDTARIAWWDGSALGLRLNCLIDIFGVVEPEFEATPEKSGS